MGRRTNSGATTLRFIEASPGQALECLQRMNQSVRLARLEAARVFGPPVYRPLEHIVGTIAPRGCCPEILHKRGLLRTRWKSAVPTRILRRVTSLICESRAEPLPGPTTRRTNSPTRGRIHLRRLIFALIQFLLAVRRRTIHYRQQFSPPVTPAWETTAINFQCSTFSDTREICRYSACAFRIRRRSGSAFLHTLKNF